MADETRDERAEEQAEGPEKPKRRYEPPKVVALEGPPSGRGADCLNGPTPGAGTCGTGGAF